MLYVTKFDGSKQPFVKEKLVNTCIRLHASPEQARSIADKIEKEAFNGITTKQLFNLLIKYLKVYNPDIRHEIDLRTAISLLRAKPDFEYFVGMILKEMGYTVEMNKIVAGKCCEYEIDAIARRGDETVLVEVKHRVNPHEYVGVDVFLENNSVFEDVVDGYKKGLNNYSFNKLLLVCNTKLSDHAKRYATCKGIGYIAWKFPKENSLEKMIDSWKLYPITMIKTLDDRNQAKLADNGIVLLKQLVESDVSQLAQSTKIKREKLNVFVNIVKKILL